MTNSPITGIEIRQQILSYGLRPSKFDEQGLFNWCQEHNISDEDLTLDMIEQFRLLKD
jgi:hypothetical protein